MLTNYNWAGNFNGCGCKNTFNTYDYYPNICPEENCINIDEIEPKNFGNIDIEFLDEHYEKKIKNVQKYEIKVELIEGNKDLITLKKIYQYYLFFNGITIDKEDFYEILKFLKVIEFPCSLNLFLIEVETS